MTDIVYSTRTCLICQACGQPAQIEAAHFGEHLGNHDPGDWPGGTVALLQALSDSLDKSIEESEGHPAEQAIHRRGQEYLRRLQVLAEKLPHGS
jgi:hypothetical protein